MEYFLCIENNPHHFWQTELLLESFRKHGIEDQLVVVVCGPSRVPPEIASHKRLVNAPNIGESRGYPKLSYLYTMKSIVEQGHIKQPFIAIESDMVLYKPVADNPTHNISFQVDPEFTQDFAEENGCTRIKEYIDLIAKAKEIEDEDFWLPVGSTMAFHKVPNVIFDRAINITERLAFDQLEDHGKIWKHTDRLAWACVLLEYYNILKYEATFSYEMTMLESRDMRNFIHYEHGLPPVFSKYMFVARKATLALSGKEPFEILAENAPTPSSHYIQQLAEGILKRKKEEKK